MNISGKSQNLPCRLFFMLPALALLCSCASYKPERREVFFNDPKTVLNYAADTPEDSEAEGVVLRVHRQDKLLEYDDTLTIYTRIEDGKGDAIEFEKLRKVIHSPGRGASDYLVSTETLCEQLSENSIDQVLMSTRGEILEFVRGRYKSKKGNIEILSWEREPVFPDTPVMAGDTWSYTEKVKLRLDSFWISRDVEGPEAITVHCKVAGFVNFRGRRCALITTSAVDNRDESYTALFRTMKLSIRSNVSQTLLLDYRRGVFVATITDTKSVSNSEDQSFFEVSESRMLSLLRD